VATVPALGHCERPFLFEIQLCSQASSLVESEKVRMLEVHSNDLSLSGCRRKFHKASNGRHLISGGNDAAVLIWDWTRCFPSDSPWAASSLEGSDTASSSGSGTIERINHGRKVNCIATCEGTAVNTFVADTSRNIKAYCIV
jgi:hypothetical protein